MPTFEFSLRNTIIMQGNLAIGVDTMRTSIADLHIACLKYLGETRSSTAICRT